MPLTNEINLAAGTRLYMWRVTEQHDELALAAQQWGVDLALCRQPKAASRRIEMMVERLLLCHIFGPGAQLMHHDNGQPWVRLHDQRMTHISITHTKQWVAVATNQDCPMGIDIERQAQRVMRVRHKFLNEREQQMVPPGDVMAHLVAWTAKEALYKAASLTEPVSIRNDLQIGPFAAWGGQHPMQFQAQCRGRHYDMLTMAWDDCVLTHAVAQQVCDNQSTTTNQLLQ